MEEEAKKNEPYTTLYHLNKRVVFFGLSSVAVFIIGLLLAIVFFIKWFIGILVLLGIVYLTTFLVKQYRNGDDDPIKTYLIKSASPKNLEDKYQLLKYLNKNA